MRLELKAVYRPFPVYRGMSSIVVIPVLQVLEFCHMEMATVTVGASANNRSLLAKSKTTSTVWEQFGLEANDNGKPVNSDKAVCRVCKQQIVAKSGNTSNLRAHLKNHHPLVFSGLLQREQSRRSRDSPSSSLQRKGLVTVASAFEKEKKYECGGGHAVLHYYYFFISSLLQ